MITMATTKKDKYFNSFKDYPLDRFFLSHLLFLSVFKCFMQFSLPQGEVIREFRNFSLGYANGRQEYLRGNARVSIVYTGAAMYELFLSQTKGFDSAGLRREYCFRDYTFCAYKR